MNLIVARTGIGSITDMRARLICTRQSYSAGIVT
jgi:hypothetical protein